MLGLWMKFLQYYVRKIWTNNRNGCRRQTVAVSPAWFMNEWNSFASSCVNLSANRVFHKHNQYKNDNPVNFVLEAPKSPTSPIKDLTLKRGPCIFCNLELHIFEQQSVLTKIKITNLSQYKVNNNFNIVNILCLWKTLVECQTMNKMLLIVFPPWNKINLLWKVCVQMHFWRY